jgi:hypothetical protein
MKKIALTNYGKPDRSSVLIKRKLYSVYLGNSETLYFQSERAAKEFLAETNRFLNRILHECNILHINTFEIYRTYWFYLDNEPVQLIVENVKAVEKIFDTVTRRGNYANGAAMAWKDLQNILGYVSEVLAECLKVLLVKKFYADIYRVNILLKHGQDCLDELLNYGKDKPEETKNEVSYLELIE